ELPHDLHGVASLLLHPQVEVRALTAGEVGRKLLDLEVLGDGLEHAPRLRDGRGEQGTGLRRQVRDRGAHVPSFPSRARTRCASCSSACDSSSSPVWNSRKNITSLRFRRSRASEAASSFPPCSSHAFRSASSGRVPCGENVSPRRKAEPSACA